jgi:uncharacterized protein
MENKTERRTVNASLRAEQSDSLHQIRGYAATFNSPSKDLGGFTEVVAPGAFKRALKEGQEVKALFNHSADYVMGRTGNHTLQLEEDERGLKFRCQLNPNVTWHQDLWQSIRRGDIAECSFAFKASEAGQRWEQRKDKSGKPCAVRTLTDVDLMDISAVCYPAYNNTSVSARSFDYQLSDADVDSFLRSELRRIGELVQADREAILVEEENIVAAHRLGNEIRRDEMRTEFEELRKELEL